MTENSLTIFTKAALMLAEANTIQKAKELKSLALTAADWAKRKGMGDEAIQYCRSYALEAERKMGEMLAETERVKGGPGRGKSGHRVLPLSSPQTLKQIGLTKRESSEAQALAAVPRETFESIKSGKKTRKEVKRDARKEKNKQREKEAKSVTATWNLTDDQSVIKCDAIITDPPYAILDEEWEPKDLEKFTRTWLKKWVDCEADTFAIFWSQRYMWDARSWFDECLKGYEFQQLLIWNYRNNKSPQSRMGFKQTYEPIFFYRKKNSVRKIGATGSEWGEDLHDFDCHIAAVPQSNFNDSEMKQHPAQKPVSVMRWLVNALTKQNELIVDPFCGSGTTGIASVQLNRRFHGIDISDKYLDLAKGRISAYGTP